MKLIVRSMSIAKILYGDIFALLLPDQERSTCNEGTKETEKKYITDLQLTSICWE